MRLEILKRPYDLYAVLCFSTILVTLIIINELSDLEIQALRVILGLPFILFFPGYVLISALYPERKKYFDLKGDPISKDEWDVLVEEREDSDEGAKDIPDGKGLDDLERVALSLGLSIAITPLIGLVLNYTYDWDPDHLGIRLLPVLLSIYAFILITGAVAISRRLKVPEEDRYGIVIDIKVPEDYSKMDKVLTVGIVIMMIASVSLLVYIIVVPREGESFTEFYILGETGMAERYPRNMILEETKFVTIGIGNHEHEDANYTLVLSISSDATNLTVDSMENVTISRTRQPMMSVLVRDGRTLEIPCNFSVLETGSYKMRYLLYMDGKEYRDLHLWIKVFEEGRFDISEDGGFEFYVTGPAGDPSAIPDIITKDNLLGVGIGARNMLDHDVDLRVTISTGSPSEDLIVDPFSEIMNITDGTSLSFYLVVNSTSSIDVLPILINMGIGEHSIHFTCRIGGEDVRVGFDIIVEG